MVFKPGNTEAKKGVSARSIVRDLYDTYQGNRVRIREALEAEAKSSPLKFYKNYIEPRLPKNIELENVEGSEGFKIIINDTSNNSGAKEVQA